MQTYRPCSAVVLEHLPRGTGGEDSSMFLLRIRFFLMRVRLDTVAGQTAELEDHQGKLQVSKRGRPKRSGIWDVGNWENSLPVTIPPDRITINQVATYPWYIPTMNHHHRPFPIYAHAQAS